jgi:ribosomal protein S18 acetylase RimI-like enzyme
VSRSHVRIRPAEQADVPELVTLITSGEVPMGASGARQFRADTLARLPERFSELVQAEDRTVLVAVEAGTEDVVGVVVVIEDEVGAVTPTRVLSISQLVVTRSLRRRGIGRSLMAAAVHLADQRGIEHIVASAATDSREANRYLARLGFAPLVVRRIASTTVLRRSLGLADSTDRLALLRRARTGGRPRVHRPGRAIGRGA